MNIKYDLNSIKINLYICTRDMLKNVYCSIVYNSKRWGISQNQLYECAVLYFCITVICVCMLSHFSCVCLFVTLWTVAQQAPLSRDSPSKNTGTGCCALFQGIFLTQGLSLCLYVFLHFQMFFTTSVTWEAHTLYILYNIYILYTMYFIL